MAAAIALPGMYASKSKQSGRPRELRRRIMLPARLRTGMQWSDTCILNISSRGLLIHSARAAPEGSTIEIRRGDHVIVARVMWRDGARLGLQSDERLPVEQIMSLGQSQALQLTASNGTIVERRKQPRPTVIDARLRGRSMQFMSVGVIAVSLALTIWSMANEALARPMAAVTAALGG
jgi:hypothetical protein